MLDEKQSKAGQSKAKRVKGKKRRSFLSINSELRIRLVSGSHDPAIAPDCMLFVGMRHAQEAQEMMAIKQSASESTICTYRSLSHQQIDR